MRWDSGRSVEVEYLGEYRVRLLPFIKNALRFCCSSGPGAKGVEERSRRIHIVSIYYIYVIHHAHIYRLNNPYLKARSRRVLKL